MKNTKNLDGDINYRLLKAQCSQQVLRILDKNIKSYYKSVQDYKKHPTKYKEKPGLPNYKKRGYEFNLYYTSQSCKIKDGKIILSKDISIPIPQYEKYSDLIKDFKQIRIKPLACGYKIEIIYEVKDTGVSKCREEKIASIDLGIDNLATLISEDFTVLFSGKFVKSYNKLFHPNNSRSLLLIFRFCLFEYVDHLIDNIRIRHFLNKNIHCLSYVIGFFFFKSYFSTGNSIR